MITKTVDVCWNCIYWEDGLARLCASCPVRKFSTDIELQTTPMCTVGERKMSGDFVQPLYVVFP